MTLRIFTIARPMNELPIELMTKIVKEIDRENYQIVRRVNRKFFYATMIAIDEILLGRNGQTPSFSVSLQQSCSKTNHIFQMEVDSLDRNSCRFRIAPYCRFGFQSLTAIIKKIITGIKANHEQNYNAENYEELARFLKFGWESFRESIPTSLRNAYQTLFGYFIIYQRHIVKTFGSLGNRSPGAMENSIQLSLIAQTWRVIEILAPSLARDPKLCYDNACCGGCVDIKIDGMEQRLFKVVDDILAIGDEKSEEIKLIWEIEFDSNSLKAIVSEVEIRPGIKVISENLIHGERGEFCTLVQLYVQVDKGILFYN
jgi:hypothetical protein